MRIEENNRDDSEAYSVQSAEMKRLLADIRKEAVMLRTLFLTEEETGEIKQITSSFDERMQEAVYSTIKHLEGYQQYAWKDLIHKGGRSNG